MTVIFPPSLCNEYLSCLCLACNTVDTFSGLKLYRLEVNGLGSIHTPHDALRLKQVKPILIEVIRLAKTLHVRGRGNRQQVSASYWFSKMAFGQAERHSTLCNLLNFPQTLLPNERTN